MQNVSTARRPLGITIISILLFIQAIFEILVDTCLFQQRHPRSPNWASGGVGSSCRRHPLINSCLGAMDAQTLGILGHVDTGNRKYRASLHRIQPGPFTIRYH